PAEDSWYARLRPLFPGEPLDDPIWGHRLEWGSRAEPVPDRMVADQPPSRVLPDWARRPIGPEPRPPRPLAPSSAGEEHGTDPPRRSAALALADCRGVLMRKLLERLPDVAPAERDAKARLWCARNAADLAENDRDDLLARALAVLAEPQWAELFGPSALAE